jgi:hypothetical protein
MKGGMLDDEIDLNPRWIAARGITGNYVRKRTGTTFIVFPVGD